MEEEEDLDPRIQTEIEKMNKAGFLINRLENELDLVSDTSRTSPLFSKLFQNEKAIFNTLREEATRELESLQKRLGSVIERARPYYDYRIKANEMKVETYKAAVKYERAIEMQNAAREMVELAEKGYETRRPRSSLDLTWQEMLNHGTCKVMEAEETRRVCENDHAIITRKYSDVEVEVNTELKLHRRSISRSKAYYEKKAEYNRRLESQKSNVEKVKNDRDTAKQVYAKALRKLEQISEEIHTRRTSGNAIGNREAGVGSDSPSPLPQETAHPPLTRAPPLITLNRSDDTDNKPMGVTDPVENGAVTFGNRTNEPETQTESGEQVNGLSEQTNINTLRPKLQRSTRVDSMRQSLLQSTSRTIPEIKHSRSISSPDVLTTADTTITNSPTNETANPQTNPVPPPSNGPSIEISKPDNSTPDVTSAESSPVVRHKIRNGSGASLASSTSSRGFTPVVRRHKRSVSASIHLSAKRLLDDEYDSDGSTTSNLTVLSDNNVQRAMSGVYLDEDYDFEEECEDQDYDRLPGQLSEFQASYDQQRTTFSDIDLKLDQVLKLLDDESGIESIV